ncbi:U32 family peptidase [Desulfuromonas sp. KJ2020]|uniref:peptidase U32 family protein n=1 Tax=Desulfuromonas sp. KJ2020 TaxID=2919173 RepID=UPI0020A788B5|nr:U32 family peptidase [Desulfuromonas sp. KJ2020]MCP3176648.1 U32 family peptidase [Desulfuromonas sp. KJ2020]
MTKPELLAPAGDMEKLETALDYGADAVYVGGDQFGLRAMAGNFSVAELARAQERVRERDKKLYLTLNAYLRPAQMPELRRTLEELRPLDLDAYIISDPGVLAVVREVDSARELHLSTQANTTNAQAARFWQETGVERVNLARELTLEEIRHIRRETTVGLEVFVHGAMCVAYSGRCLLSTALTGRSANAGACAQPCRWNYALMEETRPGQYFPIEEDDRGSYVFNSRDLCLLEYLPDLVGAGVDSLKIEGRMKTLYYVAAVTRVYRAALDAYAADPAGYVMDPAWLEELDKVSHRPYDRGFLFGAEDALVHAADSRYQRTHDFVGIVRRVDDGGRLLVECRNRFFPGEELELIGPAMRQAQFVAGELTAEGGGALEVAQPNALVLLPGPAGTRQGDLLRRQKVAG